MITVTTGAYPGNVPVVDTFRINLSEGMSLNLCKDEYQQLANAISEKTAADLARMIDLQEDLMKKRREYSAFAQDVLSLFYDQNDEWLTKKEINLGTRNQLDEIIEKHKGLLGIV